MRTVECRNAYIGTSDSNVSASLREDLLRVPLKIVPYPLDGDCNQVTCPPKDSA